MKIKKNLLKTKAKSFYFAGIFLSRDCFTNCSQLYNFCRIVDDIADNNYKNKKFLLKNIYNSITNPDSFNLMCLRSFGETFYHHITDAALEFGYIGI